MARERNRGIEVCSRCLRGILQLFNILLAFVGIAISLFAFWHLYNFLDSYNLRGQLHSFISSIQWNFRDAWFIYFLLGLGILVCFISLVGHVATQTSIGCCLSSYIFLLVFLALLEGAFVAEVLFNNNWREIIPDDPSGLLEQIEEFVEDNLVFCKWVGLTIVIVEVAAVLLAFTVRALTQLSELADHDSDDEYLPPQRRLRQPLLFIPRQNAGCTLTANTGTVEGWPVNRLQTLNV